MYVCMYVYICMDCNQFVFISTHSVFLITFQLIFLLYFIYDDDDADDAAAAAAAAADIIFNF